MSDWVVSYLASLYAAELDQRSPTAQVGRIGSIMARDREEPAEPAAED